MRGATILLCLLCALPARADLSPQHKRDMALLESQQADIAQRTAAMRRLGAVDDPAVAKLLRRLALTDPDQWARYEACEALARSQGSRAADHLQVVLRKERHLGVKEKLEALLARTIRLLPLDELEQAYAAQADADERLRLLVQMARHPAARAAAPLARAMRRDRSLAVRLRALDLLFEFDRAAGIAAATDALQEPNDPAALRAAAAVRLARHLEQAKFRPLLERALAGKPAPELLDGLLAAIRVAKFKEMFGRLLPLLEQHAEGALRLRLIETLAALAGDEVAPQRRLVGALKRCPDLEQMEPAAARALCTAIGRFGDERFVRGLASIVSGSPSMVLPPFAADALARIGGARAGKALLAATDHVLGRGAEQVTRALLRLRDPAHEPRMLRLMKQPTSRNVGINGVGWLGGAGGDESALLLAQLAAQPRVDPFVRREAIHALGWSASPVATRMLVAMIAFRGRPSSRAVETLQLRAPWLDDPGRLALLQGLERARGPARPQLILMLAFTGHASARPLLERLLDGDSDDDRRAALRGLALLGPGSSKALALARALADNAGRPVALREAGLFYLGRAGEPADVARLRRVAESQPAYRAAAAQALARIGAPGAGKLLRGWWRRTGEQFYYEFWSRLPDVELGAQLAADLQRHDRWEVRLQAAVALGWRKQGAEALRNALARDTSARVRAAAARALGATGDRNVARLLIERHAGDGSPAVRRALLETAGELGGAEIEQWLAGALKQAVGAPDGLPLLLSALRAGVRVDPGLARAIVQADTGANYMPPSGLLALIGLPDQLRWAWRDLSSPLQAQRQAAHLALERLGVKAWYDVMLRRATIEPFPRPVLQALAPRFAGAPRISAVDRPRQDAEIASLRAWWRTHHDKLVWNPGARRFELP